MGGGLMQLVALRSL